MKTFFPRLSSALLLLFLLSIKTAVSQVPAGFNYQAVARDATGEVLPDQDLKVRIGILTSIVPETVVYEAEYNVTTNAYGLFQLMVGDPLATPVTGTFSVIDWSVTPLYLRTRIWWNSTWQNMGSAPLLSVPYALVSQSVSGLNSLVVSGLTENPDEPLFEVKNSLGQTIFAVYSEGVRVNVGNGDAKGLKGGFAIGGLSGEKAGEQELFRVTTDSTRIYIPSPVQGKAVKGGFAIGGFDGAKGFTHDLLTVHPDSTRVYVREPAKGVKGGFAIGGFDEAKGDLGNYISLLPDNYFIGHEAGLKATSGSYNSVVGYQAARELTTGSYNTILGRSAGTSLTGGNNNILIGEKSGYTLTTGIHNTLIGSNAGYNHTSQEYNVMIGTSAGYHINSPGWSGSFNTFIGINAGYAIEDSRDNTFLGTNAGYWLENGSGNTFIGIDAGRAGEDRTWAHGTHYASYNTFVGTQAGRAVVSGSNSVAVGYQAGLNNASGSGNVFIGYQAGYNELTGNKLYIANSSTNPLVYGDFSAKRIGFNTTSLTKTLNVGGDAQINGTLTATMVSAPVTGNLTGNVSGNVTGTLNGSVNGDVNGVQMGRIFMNASGNAVSIEHGMIDLMADFESNVLVIKNNSDKECQYWIKANSHENGVTDEIGKVNQASALAIYSTFKIDYSAFEIHFGIIGETNERSTVYLQFFDGSLSGNYIIY